MVTASSSASDILFNHETNVAPLGLIAMRGTEELGKKIDSYLVEWARKGGYDVDTFLIACECPRFSSGDGKGLIKSTIRGRDLFILIDVGNYSCEYQMFDRMNVMSPDDHYQDLKRIIQAASGKAHRVNVIMPILYGGRQHRRNYRESLDCACALQELEQMGVSNIITFDAHDPRVCNAIPLMGFDNVVPSYQVLKAMFHDIPHLRTTPDEFMVISPDEGALNRNMYYASMLGVPMGMFYKRRDYSIIVNGRNPIVAHEYLGNSVDGLQKFDDAYANGYIDAVFGTNLTYRTKELLSREWFHEVDCSKYISFFIAALNHDASIGNVIDSNQKIKALLARRNQEEAE